MILRPEPGKLLDRVTCGIEVAGGGDKFTCTFLLKVKRVPPARLQVWRPLASTPSASVACPNCPWAFHRRHGSGSLGSYGGHQHHHEHMSRTTIFTSVHARKNRHLPNDGQIKDKKREKTYSQYAHRHSKNVSLSFKSNVIADSFLSGPGISGSNSKCTRQLPVSDTIPPGNRHHICPSHVFAS